jgi:hypothetical protein
VNHAFGFLIESLVAVLLMLTIGYCMVLNARLKRLKADEAALRATIGELLTVTEIAERAVAGLKQTAAECEDTLGERLKAAERFCADLTRQIQGGEAVLARLSRIVAAARLSPETDVTHELQSASAKANPSSLAAAARAFADRARERARTMAA